jgi:hypothetical protein
MNSCLVGASLSSSSKFNEQFSCLNKIPTSSSEECRVYAAALAVLLENGNIHSTNSAVVSFLTPLKNLLDQPEMYVKNADHFSLFKVMMRDRIALKVHQLKNLTDQYENKPVNITIDLINLNGYSLVEFMDWLIQAIQDPEFTQREGLGPFHGLTTNEELQKFFIKGPSEKIQTLCSKFPYLKKIHKKTGTPLTQLWHLDEGNLKQLVEVSDALLILSCVGITWDMLKSLPEDTRNIILKECVSLTIILASGISYQEMISLNNHVLSSMLSDPGKVDLLLKRGVTPSQLGRLNQTDFTSIWDNAQK